MDAVLSLKNSALWWAASGWPAGRESERLIRAG